MAITQDADWISAMKEVCLPLKLDFTNFMTCFCASSEGRHWCPSSGRALRQSVRVV